MNGSTTATLSTTITSDIQRTIRDLINGTPLDRGQTQMVLGFLILLTALPRIIMAACLNTICDDGYYYLAVTDSWQQGDFAPALRFLNINVYPFILWALESTGLPITLTSKIWGILISCVTVFPLFSLTRKLIDDRAASMAVVLFAIHPEMIELSVEPVRDPTFWFLFLLSLDLLHRTAVNSGNLFMAMSAGLATALAIQTRTEGWVIIVPAIAWPLYLGARPWFSLPRMRTVAVILLMSPLLILVVNCTALKSHDRWEWGRFNKVAYFVTWLNQQTVTQEPVSTAAVETVALEHAVAESTEAERKPNYGVPTHSLFMALIGLEGRTWGEYADEMCESWEYPMIVLCLVAVIWDRRRLFNGTTAPLAVMFVGSLAAVWLMFAQWGSITGRHFLTALLLALPAISLGTIRSLAWIQDVLITPAPLLSRLPVSVVPSGLCLVLVIYSWSDAFSARHPSREAQAELGKQLRDQYGPFQRALVDRPSARVGHAALGEVPEIVYEDMQSIHAQADVVITQDPIPQPLRKYLQQAKLTEIRMATETQGTYSVYIAAEPNRIQQTSHQAESRVTAKPPPLNSRQ